MNNGVHIDWTSVSDYEQQHAETICRDFFPNGKKVGEEWKIADESGADGNSLGIQLTGPNAGVWIDRATSHGGRLRQLIARNRNISDEQAVEQIEQAYGLSFRKNGTPRHSKNANSAFDWNSLAAAITDAHLSELASWRGFSVEFCAWLRDRKHIGRCNGAWSFPVTDPHAKIVGCHYLAKPDTKDWYFTKGINVSPLLIGNPQSCAQVNVFESTWDGLAFCDRAAVYKTNVVSVVITRGVSHAAKIRAVDIAKDATIYVWPQNDPQNINGTIPSEKWFDGIRANLKRKFYRVTTPSNHADLNDWTRAGASLEDLTKAISDAKLLEPSPKESATNGSSGDATEFNEAERVALLEPQLPPIAVWNREWHAFENGVWQNTPRDIYRPAALAIMPEKSRTARKAKETLDHFEALHQLPSDSFTGAYRFDDADILLNLSNGVLRIHPSGTINLEKHSQQHLFCAKLPVVYDGKAAAPVFERALVQALPDIDDQHLFLIWAASILIPSNKLESALCIYGPAKTGKSTLAGGIQAALGSQVTRFLTLKEICNDQGYHVPKLRKSMLNVSTELDTVLLENSENFKRLISGEDIEAREIYGSPFVMSVTCKFLFLTNHLPRFKFGTDAEARRLEFLRFDQVPLTVDTTLKDQIKLERNGVFNLLVEYLPELLRTNLMPHGGPNSLETRQRFAVTNDPVGSFVQNQCVLDPEDHTSKETLANCFNRFLDEIGLPQSFGDNFFKLLYDRYPTVRPKRVRTDQGRNQVVGGIGLKNV